MSAEIDFIITWLDGSDPKWIEQKNSYLPDLKLKEADDQHRYRNWDNTQYWFRGVEKFCPWVRKVHFVTWGHLPSWLNVNNPKLHIVNHKDYIPEKYLPTFSSISIEMLFHNIQELSEKFVFFNDDMFILKPMQEKDFFYKGKPCDSALLNVHCYNIEDQVILAPFRDIGVINHEFEMRKVMKRNFWGWYNYRYGVNVLRNIFLYVCPRFPGMMLQHLPTSLCKSTMREVWEKYYDILDETCSHKFRELTDVNQWLFKEWQIASGNFYPRSLKIGKNIAAYNIEDAVRCIRRQECKLMCLNDTEMTATEFERCRDMIKEAFEAILPERCSFEL